MSGRRGSNSRPIAWKAIALPTELLPLLLLWGEKDSNLRSLATTELQSVPFGHSGISPKKRASYRDRTNDLLITSQLLYQLS